MVSEELKRLRDTQKNYDLTFDSGLFLVLILTKMNLLGFPNTPFFSWKQRNS